MKKKVSIIVGLFILLGIIALSYLFVINNGKNDLKESASIKVLTYEEKTALIDEINKKYSKSEDETNNKYNKMASDIESKYTPEIEVLNKKYNDIDTELENNLNTKLAELDKKIDALRRKQTTEFFKSHGISEKYDELGAEIKVFINEQTSLRSAYYKEKSNNTTLKFKEESAINKRKVAETSSIETNRKAELARLNNKKNNEINETNNLETNKKGLMKKGITKIIMGVLIILIPFIYIIYIFNKLTRLKNAVKESWASVDVYLKQRSDLIPNILEAVKGYSNHEKKTLESVTKARNKVINATNKEEEIIANNSLNQELAKLFIFNEAYPDLKANQNFMDLQANLKEIEDEISNSRNQYNAAVLNYKNKLEIFPSNIIACIFNFKPELFFEAEEAEKENIKLDL